MLHVNNNNEQSKLFYESVGYRFDMFNELHNKNKCPFYSLDAFINNEISDYEALLEAFKIHK